MQRHPELAPRFADGVDRHLLSALLFAFDLAATQCEALEAAGEPDAPRLDSYRRLRDEAEHEIMAALRPA